MWASQGTYEGSVREGSCIESPGNRKRSTQYKPFQTTAETNKTRLTEEEPRRAAPPTWRADGLSPKVPLPVGGLRFGGEGRRGRGQGFGVSGFRFGF